MDFLSLLENILIDGDKIISNKYNFLLSNNKIE